MPVFVIVLLSAIALVIGVMLGAMPRSASVMDRVQMTVAVVLTMVFIVLLAVTYVMHSGTASWAVIIASIVGYGIGSVPAVNGFLADHWDLFELR
ncbi:hypothetical protein [Bifidobacterium simiarum]|uniref:hypothetical protein n=1 Tax=Bifidobacterium simiarum TaxID=2045441 RepID=UPI001BDD5B63|nr:hypothetical protein [Bifidobacterium simiarum]MBT1165751.1 hypothetical protein [Bifidobacterium simiarum]